MSGFNRGSAPIALNRAAIAAVVTEFLCLEDVSARILRERDPFNVDDPCPMNGGAPHWPIPSCGEVVCRHCSKIF